MGGHVYDYAVAIRGLAVSVLANNPFNPIAAKTRLRVNGALASMKLVFAAFGGANRMTATVRVEISDAPTMDTRLRFRHFGEDVYRALHERCSINIQDIDASTRSFLIRDIRSSEIGAVTQVVKRELKRRNFDKTSRLVRL